MLTTVIRFADMVYLLSRTGTSLPVSVLLLSGAMIVYGAILAIKRFTGAIKLSQIMTFFAVHAVVVAINLIITAVNVRIRITPAEMLLVGSFLDLVIDLCAVYLCFRQIRSSYKPFVRVVGNEE